MESVTSGYLIEIFHKLNKILAQQEQILKWLSSQERTAPGLPTDLYSCTHFEDSDIFKTHMQLDEVESQQEQKNFAEGQETGPFTTECSNGDPLSSQDLEVLPEWMEHNVEQLLAELEDKPTKSAIGDLLTSPPGLSKLPLKRTYHVFSMYDQNNEYHF